MRMLDDFDAVPGLEGLPVGYRGGMGVAPGQDCPTCFHLNFYPFVLFCCHSFVDVTFTTPSVLLHSGLHHWECRRIFRTSDRSAAGTEDPSVFRPGSRRRIRPPVAPPRRQP